MGDKAPHKTVRSIKRRLAFDNDRMRDDDKEANPFGSSIQLSPPKSKRINFQLSTAAPSTTKPVLLPIPPAPAPTDDSVEKAFRAFLTWHALICGFDMGKLDDLAQKNDHLRLVMTAGAVGPQKIAKWRAHSTIDVGMVHVSDERVAWKKKLHEMFMDQDINAWKFPGDAPPNNMFVHQMLHLMSVLDRAGLRCECIYSLNRAWFILDFGTYVVSVALSQRMGKVTRFISGIIAGLAGLYTGLPMNNLELIPPNLTVGVNDHYVMSFIMSRTPSIPPAATLGVFSQEHREACQNIAKAMDHIAKSSAQCTNYRGGHHAVVETTWTWAGMDYFCVWKSVSGVNQITYIQVRITKVI